MREILFSVIVPVYNAEKYLERCVNSILRALEGFKSEILLIDNKSTNTYENIKFSHNLIKKKDSKGAFSTTNYHVLRAGLIATEQGLKIDGLGSKTKSYFWINAFDAMLIVKHLMIIVNVIVVIMVIIYININA